MVHKRKDRLRRRLISSLITFALVLLMFPAGIQKVSASTGVFFEEDFEDLQSANSQTVPEEKDFPTGWKLVNVDGRTPASIVSYVNDAWIIREEFSFNESNHVMFSTSWYTPAGAADDWVWTPLLADLPAEATLTWSAKSYDPAFPDGYEVRIMTAPNEPTGSTGSLGNMVTNSTVLLSVPSESSSWTTHSVDLSAYAGQSVYIAFRNNSNDQFLLVIDDIKITYEKPAPSAPPAPTMASRTDTSITLDALAGAEFSMDDGTSWQDSPVFEGLSPNTSYSFVARVKETTDASPSASSPSATFTTDKSTPTAPLAPTLASRIDTSITLDALAGAEFSIDDGASWQDSPVFEGLTPNTSYSFIARVKEATDAYASANSPSATFTTDKSTPTAPLAPTMASRTDTTITLDALTGAEFSIDDGASWQDSPVFESLTPNTSYSFIARVKEATDAYASANSPSATFITDKPTPSAPLAPTMASRTDTTITLDALTGAEFSIDDGATWQDSPVFEGLSPNTSYSFVVRVKETAEANASANSSSATFVTDKSTPSAPLTASTMASRTDTSITLDAIAGAEYSRDNGASWQDSPVFSGLSPNTSYSFLARLKETSSAYASATGPSATFITDKSTPSAPAAPTLAKKTDTTITLNTIAGAEYSRDNGANWQDSPVFEGLSPNTSYSFVARIKATTDAYASANSPSATITTDKATDRVPDTGDTGFVPIIALMIAAFGALAFSVRKRKTA